MKNGCLLLPLLLLAGEAAAGGTLKPCAALAGEIAAKIEANGVKAWTLDRVEAGNVTPGMRVVGSCDGGRRRIVYTRLDPPAPPARDLATTTR